MRYRLQTLIGLLIGLALTSFGQGGLSSNHLVFVPAAPTGACAAAAPLQYVYQGASQGNLYGCGPALTWQLLATSGGGITQAYQTIQNEASGLTQRSTVNMIGAVVNCVDNGGATKTDCTFTQQHVVTFVIDGGGAAITTGVCNMFPGSGPNTGTISRVDVSGQPSGSITVDIWKRNALIPTTTQKISASAPATLSSSQLSQSGSLAGWTTAVAANDVFGCEVITAATVEKVTVQIWY